MGLYKPELPPLKSDMDVLNIMYGRNHSEHLSREELEYHYKRLSSIVTGPGRRLNRAHNMAKKLQEEGYKNPLSL